MNRKLLFSILGSCVVVSGTVTLAQDADVSQLLERGLYLEETKKDLIGAMSAYGEILAESGAHPEVTMQARFRLASCQLKNGDSDSAKATLHGLIEALPDPAALAEDDADRRTLDRDFAEIVERALPQVDQETLLEAAFEAIVDKLGNRADYLDKHELANFKINMDRKLVGIGLVIDEPKGNQIRVKSIIPGSPASDSGLEEHDLILEVSGRKIEEFKKGLSEVINAIRGTEGTAVSLKVKRFGSEAVETMNIVRQKLELKENPPVVTMSGSPDDWFVDEASGIAGIRINQFAKDTAAMCRDAIEEAIEQGAKAVVLDLRNNGGGSLDESVKTADLFIREGVIVKVVSRKDETQEYFAKTETTLAPDLPMVVLVNRNTASAAEIVAACLQDHQRAPVIGVRSMGVGTVRTVMSVAGGGALILPISTFVRPSGAKVQAAPGDGDNADWGVRPNEGFAVADSNTANGESDKPLARALDCLRGKIAK